jgi:Cu/Ag efflux pump CusA
MLGDLQGIPEPVEVQIFGDDMPTLQTIAARVRDRLKDVPGLVDLVLPRRGNPELEVRIDPTRAAKAGFTTQEVSTQLADGLLGDVATEVRRADRLIDLRVRFRMPSASIRPGFASTPSSRPRAPWSRSPPRRRWSRWREPNSCIAKT